MKACRASPSVGADDPLLPSWLESLHAVEAGQATPLQRFIADYEPCSDELRQPFRAVLQEVLREATKRRSRTVALCPCNSWRIVQDRVPTASSYKSKS